MLQLQICSLNLEYYSCVLSLVQKSRVNLCVNFACFLACKTAKRTHRLKARQLAAVNARFTEVPRMAAVVADDAVDFEAF